MRTPSIQHDSDIPLYAQIREALRTGILNGSYPPHSRLPSESQLQALFQVSRITIRQALSELQKEGLLFKQHGKGAFVSQPKAFQNITALEGFNEAMSRMGHEIVNRVLGMRTLPAAKLVAARLGLPEDSEVTEIRRVRLLNRSPVSMEITYLPTDLGERLRNADLVTRDVFLILENDLRVPLGAADLSIDAVPADAKTAKALGVERGAALLRIERLTHDAQGRPIDFEYLYFRGDAFQYRLRIERQRNL